MGNLLITRLADAPKVPFNLDGRILFSSGNVELIHLTLQPREKMDPHSQSIDVVFYVISGIGQLDVEKETVQGVAGVCIHVPKGLQRGWKNEGSENFCVLVIKDLK
jgi:quercetin dioxygenase-like cupin family protein